MVQPACGPDAPAATIPEFCTWLLRLVRRRPLPLAMTCPYPGCSGDRHVVGNVGLRGDNETQKKRECLFRDARTQTEAQGRGELAMPRCNNASEAPLGLEMKGIDLMRTGEKVEEQPAWWVPP